MSQIFNGNILLIFCCIFYLLWWIIAFKPQGAIKGLRSGWLLIPAAVFGTVAVIMICRGISSADRDTDLFPISVVIITAAAAYIILLAATWKIMKRPVTTELILIVGWTALASSEVSVLYGTGAYSWLAAVIFTAVILALAVISLICYLLYYNLDRMKGYVCGMIPLISVLLTALSMNITM